MPNQAPTSKREGRGPHASALRREIDAGHTRDKVDFPDPAAAPLGTDDEAAGNPPGPEAVDLAIRAEVRGDGRSDRHPWSSVFLYTSVIAVIAGAIAIGAWPAAL